MASQPLAAWTAAPCASGARSTSSAIFSGQYRPGDSLGEEELAGRLE